jgi:hypothetical protein
MPELMMVFRIVRPPQMMPFGNRRGGRTLVDERGE